MEDLHGCGQVRYQEHDMAAEVSPQSPHAQLVLADLFHALYRPLRLAGGSKKTTSQHKIALRHFGRMLCRPATVGDLNNLTVSRFMDWLSDGRKAITVNKTVDKIVAQWRFLFHQGYTTQWPELRKLPEPESTPEGWLDDEMSTLFDALQRVKGNVGEIRAADWWTALHLVIYDSGERIGAVMEVLWSDYDRREGWLNFRAEVRKGKKRPKLIRLHPDSMAALEKIILPKRAKIFHWPKSDSLLWTDYTGILTGAGLPSDRRSKFHRMRRTVASRFEAAGGNATELLDHTSRKVTRLYLDPRIIGLPQASDLLPRPGSGP